MKWLTLSCLLAALFFVQAPLTTLAQNQNPAATTIQQTGLQDTALAGGVPTSTDIHGFAGNVIRYLLAVLGIIFFVIIVYSGFQWMTSGGNETKTTQARQRMTNAAIGLAVILAAYAIAAFIINSLAVATGVPVT